MPWKYFLFAILAVGIFSAGFHGLGFVKVVPWQIVYSDVFGFYQQTIVPGLPYLVKQVEYPVITGWFIHLMAVLGQSQAGYYILNALFLILFAVVATYFLYKLSPKENQKRLWLYWILAPSMLVFAIFNWDILAVLFVVLALYCIQKDKSGWASFFLALGFCSKFFPIIFLAPLLLKQHEKKEWIKIIGIFLLTVGAINLPFILANFDGWSHFFTFNSLRNSNPTSIWTIVRYFFRGLDVPAINLTSLILFASSFGFLLWKYYRENTIKLCFVGVLLFLIFNKVFSPQYILWLLPFLVLLPMPKKSWFYTLEFTNLAALFLALSWFFERNINYIYWSMPFVIIRHIALIVILVAVLNYRTKRESIARR